VERVYRQVDDEVPSVDRDIARCTALSGHERTDCWVRFDEDLTTRSVPWVPYLWTTTVTATGPTLTRFEFDQFSATISLCHIAVNNEIDPVSFTGAA
jgi:hypothetical protein